MKNTLSLILFAVTVLCMTHGRNNLVDVIYYGFYLVVFTIFLTHSNK